MFLKEFQDHSHAARAFLPVSSQATALFQEFRASLPAPAELSVTLCMIDLPDRTWIWVVVPHTPHQAFSSNSACMWGSMASHCSKAGPVNPFRSGRCRPMDFYCLSEVQPEWSTWTNCPSQVPPSSPSPCPQKGQCEISRWVSQRVWPTISR